MDFLYCKKLYCYLKNGKAARKLKKQMNRRYRKEMKEEDMEDTFVQDIWEIQETGEE